MEVGHGEGPLPAKVMLVGEAWGETEQQLRRPFVGASGYELERMLKEVGINRGECYVTNLVNARPPMNDLFGEIKGNVAWICAKKNQITSLHIPLRDKMVLPIVAEGHKSLLFEIEQVRPNLIIAFGNAALWALTGEWGIKKWRGSQLKQNFVAFPSKVVPTFHPAYVLRDWSVRSTVIQDLRRAARHTESRNYDPEKWNFLLRPSMKNVMDVLYLFVTKLQNEPIWLDFDIETRHGHIACAGVSWSANDALCIPFMCVEKKEGYWTEEEEAFIVYWLRQVLCHPNARVRGQNLLYDCQYTYKWWHWTPRVAQDTMISFHVGFAGLPKKLDFQASLLCDNYTYWKDDGKEWDKKMGEDSLWRYNCLDCVRTREVGEKEKGILETLGLAEQDRMQQELFWPVLYAMQRGVRVDSAARKKLSAEIQEENTRIEQYFVDLLGHPLNPASPKQMTTLFYGDLQQKEIKSRAKKGIPGHVTCDDEALRLIGQREPLLLPLVDRISDLRTLRVLDKTFLQAKVGEDGRMRSGFNICGTQTYRLSSSMDAFGSGANLQNIPSDKSKTAGKAAKRGMEFPLPNIRKLYIPDPGMTFFDLDLDRADLQVVVWESDDELLKSALRIGADIHLLNVYSLDNREPPPLEELAETHPRYWDHRGPRKLKREFAKVFCHATNYLGSARTVASSVGRTVGEVDRAQALWFGVHPGIKRWHLRVESFARKHHYIENAFGFRLYIFDRLDAILSELVAWIPQSTVGITINKIWLNLFRELHPTVQTLIQVHDSLAGQFPTHLRDTLLPRMTALSRIVIPYLDPLIIPAGIKTSEFSWGDCQ